jgi:predicted HicB family RNase H-like nuclease
MDRGNTMTNAMTCKGHTARIEYDDDDRIFAGRIAGIRDGVGFHADTVEGLREAFHEAVEDYVETCAKVGKEPQQARLQKVTATFT